MHPVFEANYTAQVAHVRAAAHADAAAFWARLGSYRDPDAAKLVKTLVPRIEGAQRTIGRLTDAYITRTAADGMKSKPLRAPLMGLSTEALRGVAAPIVYERPFVAVYTALSRGKPLPEAVDAGAARLKALVGTGLELAVTKAAQAALTRAGVAEYDRVISPDDECALCVLASLKPYRTDQVMPIHPGGCTCLIRPRFPDTPRPADTLERARAAVKNGSGVFSSDVQDAHHGDTVDDYTRLIATHEHGEIGSVLGVHGQHWDGPGSIPS